MRLFQGFLVLLPLLVGCAGGGVQAVLKSPVNDKCSSAGLQGCPELVDGVLFYVEGDEVKGKEMVLKAAGANTPGKVKKYAKQLKKLNSVPGVSTYAKKVNEIADIMLADAKARTPPKKTGAPGVAGAPGAAATDDEDELDTTIMPPH